MTYHMITPTLILPLKGEESFLENQMPRGSAAGYFTYCVCIRKTILGNRKLR
jgi:hypothetical protein